jgi:hypothetical protein
MFNKEQDKGQILDLDVRTGWEDPTLLKIITLLNIALALDFTGYNECYVSNKGTKN